MTKKSNKWLLIFVVAAVVVCVPIILKSKGEKHVALNAIPIVNPTGDTTADTLATVQAEVEKVEESNQQIIGINSELTRTRLQSAKDVGQIKNTQGKVDKNLRDLNAKTQNSAIQVEGLVRQIDLLKRSLSQLKSERRDLSANGLPVGFGFDEKGARIANVTTGNWEKPLDAIEDSGKRSGLSGFLNRDKPKSSSEVVVSVPKKKNETLRVLTIANNTTGLNSIALTAMVGRIPVKGTIPDPYPFKLIMGKDNIVANGLELPEVSGMIWSGVAKGDWNLSCVAGDLYSVTFVFQDGTIVTHEADVGDAPLGWISDENGFPCISGEFITNAPQFLGQKVGLTALGVAGEAYAEAQRTRQSSLLGSESFVSGSTGKFVLGESASGATKEISEWLLERQQQSFDAVVAFAGVNVGIHITEELNIDYKLNGRKLRHEQLQISRRNLLD